MELLDNNFQSQMLDLTYHHADQIIKSPQGHTLYIGDASAAEDVAWLKQNHVRTVITVATGFHFTYDSAIKQIRYDLQDKKTENISAYFDMGAYQIDKYIKTGSVLVHCGAGVSRSPTLVIAYLIKYKAMGFLQALKFLKSKRPQVCPNLGFQLQLKTYEKMQKSAYNTFTFTRKNIVKKELPILAKKHPQTSYNKSFHNQPFSRGINLTMSKSLKPSKRQKDEFQYLAKMAEFRFGITNMSRWRIMTRTQQFKKQGNQ